MEPARSIAVALAMTLCAPVTAAPETSPDAKPVHDWSRLATVSPDHTVQITLRDGRSILGTIQQFRPDGLAVLEEKRLTRVKFKQMERPAQYRQGQSVDLTLRDGRVLSGRLQKVSTKDEEVWVAETRIAEQLKREDVVRVRRTDRGKPALIGAAVGAAALTGVLAASNKDSLGPGESATTAWAGVIAGGVILGGAVGAGVGALIGHRITIYEAPRR